MDKSEERPAGLLLRIVFGSDAGEVDRERVVRKLSGAAVEIRTAPGKGIDIVAGDSLEELKADPETRVSALAAALLKLIAGLRHRSGTNPPWLELRVIGEEVDLLYSFPPPPVLEAARALADDLIRWEEPADTSRWWFRDSWVGMDHLWRQTALELETRPLTTGRVLALLEGGEYPDWRPVQHFIARHASCVTLAAGFAQARTEKQKWRLCYAIQRRPNPCKTVVESLIGLLRDESSTVRQEAANALGAVFWRDRSTSRRGAHQAATALARYLGEHPDDGHYFTLTALGATGDRAAKPVLEKARQHPDERLREAAERGLANLSR